MTPSLVFPLLSLLVALGCAAPSHRDADTGARNGNTLVRVRGELRADGSCRVVVNGAPLFAAADSARAAYDSGAVADVAPAGYALHQLTCAPGGADLALPPERGDERMLIVTLYTRERSALRPGRYVVHAGLADANDNTGIAERAGIAIFGSRATHAGGANRAGVRFLEGREGILDITSVDGAHVVGRFDVRAGEAWSM